MSIKTKYIKPFIYIIYNIYYIILNLFRSLSTGSFMFVIYGNTSRRRRKVEWSLLNGGNRVSVAYRSSLQSSAMHALLKKEDSV